MNGKLYDLLPAMFFLAIVLVSCGSNSPDPAGDGLNKPDTGKVIVMQKDNTFFMDTNLVFNKIFDVGKYAQSKFNLLDSTYKKLKSNTTNIDSLDFWKDSIYYDIVRETDVMRLKFLEQNAITDSNYFFLILLSQKNGLSKDRMINVYNKMPAKLKENQWGNKIYSNLTTRYQVENFFDVVNRSELYNVQNVRTKIQQQPRYKSTLLVLWASWCGPCRFENKALIRKLGNYDTSSIRIIGIAVESAYKNWKKAMDMDGYPWENFMVLDRWKSNLVSNLKLQSIPYNIAFDGRGNFIKADQNVFAVLETLK